MEQTYSPDGETLKRFLSSSAFVRGIQGPFGSGKSTACAIEILRRAAEQEPGPDGVRRTRWAVVRNTYPELKSTTIKTWNDWVPREWGKMNFGSPISHRIKTQTLDVEVLFLALDRDEDVRKLLSLEITGAWLNEARDIPKAIMDAITGRVGRYPPQRISPCTWSGVIMDTNPADTESWWYRLAEETKPEGFEFFKQPGGLDPNAENRKYLPKNYYERLTAGKSADWVTVYVHGQYGYVVEGQVVFPMYRDSTHGQNEIKPNENFPLIISCDWGIAPCAVIGQKLPNGQWFIVDEYISDDCGVKRFAEKLTSYVELTYPNFTVGSCYGDPSGMYRGKESEETCFEIMNSFTPYKWYEAPGDNDIAMRLEAVRNALNRMIDGMPGILFGPKCKKLKKGFVSGYHYKYIEGSGGTRAQETPNKNEYSHIHDALQYLLLGAGEASIVLAKKKKSMHPRLQAQMNEAYDPLNTKYTPEGW